MDAQFHWVSSFYTLAGTGEPIATFDPMPVPAELYPSSEIHFWPARRSRKLALLTTDTEIDNGMTEAGGDTREASA